MHPDLARLIDLQRLELTVEHAHRWINDEPQRAVALDTRLDTAKHTLADAKQRLADSQTARRAVEKDLAAIQGRLSKYKDQLMEVKTNREYQAMQKEIEVAQHEVRAFEDKILERMLEADEITAQVKQGEAVLKEEERAIAAERDQLRRELESLKQQLEKASTDRVAIVASIPADTLAVYERIAKGRKGIAMALARDGHCTVCHVRLRPQIFNEVRRNDRIIQCDSCTRILYFDVAAQQASSTPSSASA